MNKSESALVRTKKKVANTSQLVRAARLNTRSAKSEVAKVEHHAMKQVDLLHRKHEVEINQMQREHKVS